jgi:hypothetical protein
MKKSPILVAIASVAFLSACGSSSSNTSTDPLSCANYCATIASACTGAPPAGNSQYSFIDNQDCNAYCNGVHWNLGTVDPNAHEDTLGCRVAHAQLAANPGPASLHCWHAGPTGGNLCGNYCENYCELALEACTGANQLYPDRPAFLAACAGIRVSSTISAQTGDNVQCRIWHLSEAMTGKILGNATLVATHCPHGKAVGSAVCIGTTP